MNAIQVRPTWFEIDLDAIAHNYAQLRGHMAPGVSMYACLKRNAYGCGTVPVARTLSAAGCNGFAFGNIDDAIAARLGGITEPILLYPNCLPDSASVVQEYGLTISISSVKEAQAWNDAVATPQPIFVKVDVGAYRAGVLPRDAAQLLDALDSFTRLSLDGAYGHIHLGSVQNKVGYVRWQLANYLKFEDEAAARNIDLPVSMVSSSSTFLDFPEADLTGVDPGRLLFGLQDGPSLRHVELRPALLAFKTRLLGCRSLDGVELGGFPPPFEIKPGMRTGVLPVGWGDGLPRSLPAGASALIRGSKVPLLGPVHLEHTRIDLTNVPDAELGDEVVLIGRQGAVELTLDEVTTAWGSGAAYFHGLMAQHIAKKYVGQGAAEFGEQSRFN